MGLGLNTLFLVAAVVCCYKLGEEGSWEPVAVLTAVAVVTMWGC